jgi:hypothetical protein
MFLGLLILPKPENTSRWKHHIQNKEGGQENYLFL